MSIPSRSMAQLVCRLPMRTTLYYRAVMSVELVGIGPCLRRYWWSRTRRSADPPGEISRIGDGSAGTQPTSLGTPICLPIDRVRRCVRIVQVIKGSLAIGFCEETMARVLNGCAVTRLSRIASRPEHTVDGLQELNQLSGDVSFTSALLVAGPASATSRRGSLRQHHILREIVSRAPTTWVST
jgi:hypothetical protein